ncbi:putative transposase DNA-binding domain protein [compost metagenome]
MSRSRTNDLFELPRSFALKLAPQTNAGKLQALRLMQKEWQRVLPLAFRWYWAPFLKGGAFPFKPRRSGPASTFPATRLVTSQKDLMALSIEAQARSWASNLQRRLARTVMCSPALAAQPVLRRELLWVNAMQVWLLPYREQLALLANAPAREDSLTSLSIEASRWMRKLARSHIRSFRLPNPRRIPLQVNQLSATLAPAKNTRSPWVADWLRISTLERGKRVELPLMDNPYARSRGGRLAATLALYEYEGRWFARSTRYIAPTPREKKGVDVLAIDLGLRNLIATSEGDLLGVGFLSQLRRYDAQLQQLQTGLQQAGQRRLAACRRYRALVGRMRGWLKTTVQTHLKAVLERHRPKRVVIEDLAFSGSHGELSRRMNRLVRGFGQRFFKHTLAQRQAEFGFVLEEVNPAYSSQTCAACGFVHRSNRAGDRFQCKACGHRAHADVNAAKNLAGRSSAGPQHELACAYLGRRDVLARALQLWAARLRATLQTSSDGHGSFKRAAGCARAGLAHLQAPPSGMANKCPAVRGVKEGVQGLLKGLSWVTSPRYTGRVSTRFSGYSVNRKVV